MKAVMNAGQVGIDPCPPRDVSEELEFIVIASKSLWYKPPIKLRELVAERALFEANELIYVACKLRDGRHLGQPDGCCLYANRRELSGTNIFYA